jgi:subtilisin-like proprotein convertase family protein
MMPRRQETLLLGVLLVAFIAAQHGLAATRYDSIDVPKTITPSGTIISTVEVGASGPIDDVDVVLDISLPWDEDLDVYLLAPDDTRVELFTDVGDIGADFTQTVLDDEAAMSIQNGDAPFTGRYRPEGSLSALAGREGQGTWRLEVTNDEGWFIGTLNSWALVLGGNGYGTYLQPPTPVNPDPADGAAGVPTNATLSWRLSTTATPAFRFLAATSEEEPDPFALFELRTDPANSVRIDASRGVHALDFSLGGELYGCNNYALLKLTVGDTEVSCTEISDFHSTTDASIAMTGLAFHPDGTLYGSTLDLVSHTSVIYTIDEKTAFVTEVCRMPFSQAVVWAIDFSPEGKLYAAFNKLMLVDLDTCQATYLGDVLATDIDWAPDGFLYAVDKDTKMLYQMDPLLRGIVAEYGPYGISTWGLASEVLDTPVHTLVQNPTEALTGVEHLNLITFDVFLDTASPPTTVACTDTEMQQYDCGNLDPCTTYYWQIVAKSGGGTAASNVWSFTTESVPADFDKDCDVDFRDLAVFASYWLFSPH